MAKQSAKGQKEAIKQAAKGQKEAIKQAAKDQKTPAKQEASAGMVPAGAEPRVLARRDYNDRFGPTTDDRVRLADTDLVIRIDVDWCGGPGRSGNEMVFGGGKSIRESMGQSHIARKGVVDPGTNPPGEDEPVDTVITGALIVDHWGIVKADVGLFDGRIVAIGKAYNPETMDRIHDNAEKYGADDEAPTPTDFVVGPETDVISGAGRILTAGGIDTHVHFVCPNEIHEALAAGVTTLIGGGTGPSEASRATTVTPGEWHIHRTLEALDAYPVNIGLLAKGSTVNEEALKAQLRAGTLGLKIHEDWGATAAVLDAALAVCEEDGYEGQVALHADSMNEAGFVQNTFAATKGRPLHVFHVEGAGGGHAPDMITLVAKENVLPASTNPTRPLTVNTVKEHMDMMIVCHHLNPEIDEDLEYADSRIRPSTMAAEDLLHDMGAISMMSSDAQAMGRIGEMIMRTWQTAHVMKSRYGLLDQDNKTEHGEFDGNEYLRPKADNYRVRRYIAKYTINPAIAHGIDDLVGSVKTGKLADLVLWEPKFFGVKPHMVLKGGQLTYAQVGDANASIPTPQPVLPRPVWGSCGRAPKSNSVNFVVRAAIDGVDDNGNVKAEGTGEGELNQLGLLKQPYAVESTRHVTKTHMKLNDGTPEIVIHPDTFQVSMGGADTSDVRVDIVDGAPINPHVDGAKPRSSVPVGRNFVTEVPMAQRYFLF